MSGEVNTSLGNGFTNLMIALFFAAQQGLTDLRALFEGDDGVAAWPNGAPSVQKYARLGYDIKMLKVANPYLGGFCGVVMDPEVGVNIREPMKILGSFGFVSGANVGLRRHKARALLRAKALSYLYELSGCPIVTPLCMRVLRETEPGSEFRGSEFLGNAYQRAEIFKVAASKPYMQWFRPIDLRTRRVFETAFPGWTIPVQMEIERRICEGGELLDLYPVISHLVHNSVLHYTTQYHVCSDLDLDQLTRIRENDGTDPKELFGADLFLN